MDKFSKIREKCGNKAAIINDQYNRRWLTGFETTDGVVLVTPVEAYFITDFRYYEAACAKCTGVTVVLQDKIYEQLDALLKKSGVSAAVLEDSITVASQRRFENELSVELTAESWLTELLAELRSVKTDEEVEKICAAQRIADGAFQHILGYIKPGVAERDVACELEYYMRKHGAGGTSFDTICVAGKKSSLPHGVPGDEKICSGDFLTMDYGAKFDGYCSDMTRTVAVGNISDEQKKVYDTVLKAQLAAIDAAHAGMTGRELDSVARDIIYSAGYEGCFGHGLGHSLGLEIHEPPRASQAWEGVLRTGTVITIEPGIYLSGRFGVRIEDMVLLFENGCRDLTGSPKELIVL